MAEYIDLDKKIIVVDTRGRKLETTVRHILDFNNGEYEADDAQLARHGRWVKRKCGPGEFECKCSVCGYRDFMIPWHDTYWFNRNYCPNCGAKMDGGK